MFAAFGAPVFIPELLTKNTVVAPTPTPPLKVLLETVLKELGSEFVA